MFNKAIRKIKRKIIDRLVANLPSMNERIGHYDMRTLTTAYYNYGPTDEIMTQFSLWEKSHWQWQHGHSSQWIIYMACCLEKGMYGKAKSTLRTYFSVHGLKDIHLILSVADFAHKNNYTNDKIRRSSEIYNCFLKNNKSNDIAKLIQNKSIAFVGNGPQEMGRRRGEEIDSHDIVIRMNSFSLEGYEKDYGTRTDIWSKGGGITRNDFEFDYIIYAHNYDRIFSNEAELEDTYNYIKKHPEKVVFLGGKEMDSMFEWKEFFNPTTGCRTLWWLYKQLGTLENVDIYGMSFPYKNQTMLDHYSSNFVGGSGHNMYIELAFMRHLYYGLGGGNNPAYNDEIKELDKNY